MTWLALFFAVHTALASPGCTVLLFSRRDQEAVELLTRVKGIYKRLPEALQPGTVVDNDHVFQLSTGSRVLCFPTTAGDSYTAKLAIVDEADLTPDLKRLMGAVKPTIDAGGSMLLLSRVDKSKPRSPFKQIYITAGDSEWHPTFLPWSARPDRGAAWYEKQKRDCLARTGALDQLYEQYPSTPDEALAPNQLDKRIPIEWLVAQSVETAPMHSVEWPMVRFYADPVGERRYVIGADPAEGNPNSDDSAAVVLDLDTGEQVAEIQGKIEISVFADLLSKLAKHYHDASLMVERNNHGHAVIEALREMNARILTGHDGKLGWLSSGRGKVLAYDTFLEVLRDGGCWLRSAVTRSQLASIEGGTLSAPAGLHDDLAYAYILAVMALSHPHAKRKPVRIG